MPAQRQALETLRAVENGRWLVRASNTGSSGAIDPQGQTLFLSRRGEYGTFVFPVTPQTQLTPYTRWGEVWLWGLWGLLILGYVKGTQDAKLGKS
jgi:apolipoprotein N-acyltransferase